MQVIQVFANNANTDAISIRLNYHNIEPAIKQNLRKLADILIIFKMNIVSRSAKFLLRWKTVGSKPRYLKRYKPRSLSFAEASISINFDFLPKMFHGSIREFTIYSRHDYLLKIPW